MGQWIIFLGWDQCVQISSTALILLVGRQEEKTRAIYPNVIFPLSEQTKRTPV